MQNTLDRINNRSNIEKEKKLVKLKDIAKETIQYETQREEEYLKMRKSLAQYG